MQSPQNQKLKISLRKRKLMIRLRIQRVKIRLRILRAKMKRAREMGNNTLLEWFKSCLCHRVVSKFRYSGINYNIKIL